MSKNRPLRRKALTALAGAGIAALALSACSSGSSGASADPKAFTFLSINENTTIPSVLTDLSKNQCSAENKALPLKINKQAQGTLDQQLQLLAGQNALPTAFVSANSPDLTQKLFTSGKVVDFGASGNSAVSDNLVPTAQGAVKALYDGKTIVLPTELNIEGIWYNKKLLSDNGISEAPSTWDDLTADMATLKAAGVQPISDAGKAGDGWGITRWVGAYLYRSLGPDALADVKSGKAKLTDAKYVAAADEIAALGKKGYFGSSPNSVDYATALNTFLSGKAGFYYMGSWAVSAFNDPKQNKNGTDNIGFIPFPTVSGGKGSADQTPTNVGTDIAVSASQYKNAKVKAWVDCIGKNYGTVALKNYGQITGIKADSSVKVPTLTKLTQDQIDKTTSSVQWFEALFPAAATTASQNNGGLLGAGQVTGSQFMQTVSSSLSN